MQHPDFPLRERASWAQIWMEFALSLARGRSSCQRYQVGCVIVPADNSGILSLGYNGSYRGGLDECDDPTVKGGCGCLHAEANAIFKLNYSAPSKVAYVTAAPCKMCAKALVNAGIDEVNFYDAYTYVEGIHILNSVSIPVYQVQPGSFERVQVK